MGVTEVLETWERFKAAEAAWDDPERMVLVHAENIVFNDGVVRGRDEARRFERDFHAAFPDWKREYLEVVIGEERIAFRWCARGTHLGRYSGYEPTGRRFEITGASFMRVSGGLITESHTVRDPRALWDQLGLPVPGA
jgi:predicted ester cyclase